MQEISKFYRPDFESIAPEKVSNHDTLTIIMEKELTD